MFDVKINGVVIARAENEQQKKIYILDFLGVSNKEIADRLNISLKFVARFTEGGSTR
jgi:DNA-directed RNA polymerase specialized sigma24 family protein